VPALAVREFKPKTVGSLEQDQYRQLTTSVLQLMLGVTALRAQRLVLQEAVMVPQMQLHTDEVLRNSISRGLAIALVLLEGLVSSLLAGEMAALMEAHLHRDQILVAWLPNQMQDQGH